MSRNDNKLNVMPFICTVALIVVGLHNPFPTPNKITNTDQDKTHQSQQPSSANQRGTKNSPVFVEVVPTPKTQEEAAHDAEEYKNKSANETELVKFTGRLFWATVALAAIGGLQLFVFGIQAHRLKQTVKAAEASSEAYMRGERALILMQKFDGYILSPVKDGGSAQASCCGFSLMNYGKTPARIVAFRAQLQIGGRQDRPDDTSIYNDAGTDMAPSMAPQNGDLPQIAYFKDESRIITVEELRNIQETKSHFLWLCILIRYEDIFRSDPVHETKFCYIFDPDTLKAGPIFRLAGPAEYNAVT
jgi:hypothetical protein